MQTVCIQIRTDIQSKQLFDTLIVFLKDLILKKVSRGCKSKTPAKLQRVNRNNCGAIIKCNSPTILNIFLTISFNMCFGPQKNRLIETILLSTHNIYVLVEKSKKKIKYMFALFNNLEACYRSLWDERGTILVVRLWMVQLQRQSIDSPSEHIKH